MKTGFKVAGIIFGSIIAIYLIAGFTGLIDLQFYRYFGTQKASVERQIFKEGKSYTEGMASDLAKYRKELAEEKDETAQKAIINLIVDKYANFDIDKLESQSLRNFLRDILEGNTKKYINTEEK